MKEKSSENKFSLALAKLLHRLEAKISENGAMMAINIFIN